LTSWIESQSADFERIDARETRGVIDQAIDASKVLFHLEEAAISRLFKLAEIWVRYHIRPQWREPHPLTIVVNGDSRARLALQCNAAPVWRCR
jgi:hypothetical protein